MASASFLSYFFKIPSSYGGELAEPLPSPKTPIIRSTLVEMVMERAVGIDIRIY